MKRAEAQKIQRQPMPKADGHHVDGNAQHQPGAAQATQRHLQRHEQIIGQPQRQAHMPAPPHVLNIGRCERRVKIRRPGDAKQLSYAERDVGVTRKIRIKLQRVAANAGGIDAPIEPFRFHIYNRDERAQPVRDQQFEHQPAEDEAKPVLDSRKIRRRPGRAAPLREKILRPLDRPADDLREKGRIEAERRQIGLQRRFVPIHFHQIGDEFERVVGQAERKQQPFDFSAAFEARDEDEQRGDAAGQKYFFGPLFGCMRDRAAGAKGGQAGQHQQQQIRQAPARIERIGQGQQIPRAPSARHGVKRGRGQRQTKEKRY